MFNSSFNALFENYWKGFYLRHFFKDVRGESVIVYELLEILKLTHKFNVSFPSFDEHLSKVVYVYIY